MFLAVFIYNFVNPHLLFGLCRCFGSRSALAFCRSLAGHGFPRIKTLRVVLFDFLRPPSLSAFSGARRSITTSSLSDLGIVLPPFLKNKCLHRQSHRRYGRHQSAISVQRGKPVFPLCHNRARFVGECRPVLQGHNQYHSPPRLAVP